METEQDENTCMTGFLENYKRGGGRLVKFTSQISRMLKEGKGEVALAAREMLGDVLPEMGRLEAAMAEYEKSIKVDPNRFNRLYGAGRVAALAHERGKAAAYYE